MRGLMPWTGTSQTTLTREEGYRFRVRLYWHLERLAAGEEGP